MRALGLSRKMTLRARYVIVARSVGAALAAVCVFASGPDCRPMAAARSSKL